MASKQNGVQFFVPVNFDATSTVGIGPTRADEAHWFLTELVSRATSTRHDAGRERFVPVHSSKLRRMLGREAEAVRNALLVAKVIECDDTYLPQKHDRDGSGKSLGYRLADAYANGFRMMPCGDRGLARRVLLHRITRRDKPVYEWELEGIEAHLHTNLKSLAIDREGAYAEINDLVKASLEDQTARVAACRFTVDQLMGEQDYPSMSWCPYGRCHTVVTRLLSQARAHLRFKGQPLVSLDVRNSQPVFLSLLLIESFFDEMSADDEVLCERHLADDVFGWRQQGLVQTSSGITQSCRLHIKGVEGCSVGASPSPWATGVNERHGCTGSKDIYDAALLTPRLRDKIEGMPHDAIAFVAHTLDGTIYDRAMRHMGATDRRAFKSTFFRAVLYGHPNRWHPDDRPLARSFANQYPTVSRFIKWAKRHDYTSLPKRMQEREARYVYGQVVNRLWQHHADAPVVTIHDSILTTPDHVETVARVMREEFEKLGVVPVVKVG